MATETQDDDSSVEEKLLESSKRLFARSTNADLQKLGGDQQQPEPTYSSDEIFVGWNLGDKKLFGKLVDQHLNELQRSTGVTDPRKIRNEAVQRAIRKFSDLIGELRQELFLDRGQADLAFWGGERGSGKSFNLRSATNRSAEADVTNIIIDPEHEYVSNNFYEGIQNDLANLRKREKPKQIDTRVLMPHFVYKAREDNDLPETGYEYTEMFKFEFRDLDPDDLNFVFTRKFKDHPDFYDFTSRLQDMLDQGDMIKSWDDVIRLADEMQAEEEFEYRRRADQIRRFIERHYRKWGFLGSDKKIGDSTDEYSDLAGLLNEYNTVVLSLHDGEWLPDDLYMKELYVAFLIKRVRNLVERRKVPTPIRWSIDEAHKYIPAHTEPEHPPSKAEIRRLIKRDRKRGQSLNMASQEPTDVAGENFLNQTKHFFIPRNMRPKPRMHLLKKANAWRSGDKGRDKWGIIFDAIKEKLDFGWLYVNSETGYWCVLEPASPLAYHRTEA